MLFLVFFTTLAAIIFAYFKWTFKYWERKGLIYLTPQIPYGNIKNPFKYEENLGDTLHKIYKEMKERKWEHGGLFFLTSPAYFVVDLEYIQNVMARDFQYFMDHQFYHNEKDDPLSAHIFAIRGEKWRKLRTILTPAFTLRKIRAMFPTFLECTENLKAIMFKENQKKEPIDIKEIFACFTTDIIGSVAFGLELKTFQKEDSPFRLMGKRVFTESKYQFLKIVFANAFPKLAHMLGITVISKDITKFFISMVKEVVDHREKNNITREDCLQSLIELKNNSIVQEHNNKTKEHCWTIEEITAQCFGFYLAGYETTSTMLSVLVYELAKHPEIQDKVRGEINSVLTKYEGKITYDAMQDLKYMNQVIDEALRMYPPVPYHSRVCVEDYKLPNDNVIIEKGTTVMISVLGIHYDEDYYPNPEKFDPERFSEANKKQRPHYAFLPFGEGPRICLGARFGIQEIKVGLTSILPEYKFKVNKRTQEPLRRKVRSFVFAAEGEIWLDVEKV